MGISPDPTLAAYMKAQVRAPPRKGAALCPACKWFVGRVWSIESSRVSSTSSPAWLHCTPCRVSHPLPHLSHAHTRTVQGEHHKFATDIAIKALGLEGCAGTLVGNAMIRCAGGWSILPRACGHRNPSCVRLHGQGAHTAVVLLPCRRPSHTLPPLPWLVSTFVQGCEWRAEEARDDRRAAGGALQRAVRRRGAALPCSWFICSSGCYTCCLQTRCGFALHCCEVG